MAIFFDAEVTPDALTAFVRELPTPDDLAFFNTIGTRFVEDHEVDFSELIHTNRVASFRTWDGNFPTLGRDSASSSKVPLIPLGVQASALGEYERLQLQFAKTGGTNKAALANAIYNDAETLTNSIYNRLELAWGDVFTDGILTVRENGIAGNAGVPTSAWTRPARSPPPSRGPTRPRRSWTTSSPGPRPTRPTASVPPVRSA